MSEHTQTPWRVEQDTDLIWGACNPDDISSDGMGYSIVQGRSSSWGERKPDMAEREANATHIVKCVNSHDVLVKALERMTQTFRPFTMKPVGGEGSQARLEQQDQIEAHREAIAALTSIKESE